MTENKTSSSNPEDPLAKQALAQEAERQLLPRLKFMGYALFFFSLCAFGYAFIEDPAFIVDSVAVDYIEEELAEFQEVAPLNPYMIASSFATVGIACFFCVWRKKKRIHNDTLKK